MKQFIDKLIERLEEESRDMQENMVKSTSNSMANFCSGACGAYNKTIAIINQLAEEHKDDIQTIDVSELLGEQGNDGWIPCSSGVMPKANGWYLVTNELGVVQEQRWSAGHWEKLRDDAVIAWCELPAPYQLKGE